MTVSRFDIAAESLSDLQKVQNHLCRALGVKLSRTKSIERIMKWLAAQLDAGIITQSDLAELPQSEPVAACSLCRGSGTITVPMPHGATSGKELCPRCSGS